MMLKEAINKPDCLNTRSPAEIQAAAACVFLGFGKGRRRFILRSVDLVSADMLKLSTFPCIIPSLFIHRGSFPLASVSLFSFSHYHSPSLSR